MQPVNYGMSPYPQSYPQGYPIYPNCFDQLTTHGVIADDAMQYITDVPSPYLQNYVAQRGWAPSMPGQVMPDPLPGMQPQQKLPRGDVYQKVPGANQEDFIKKNKYDTIKKVALGALAVGLGVFAIMKGKQGINWLKSKLGRTPAPAAPITPTTPAAPAATTSTPWYKKVWQYFGG